MTSEEQTQAVEELETRVERIRALYEQYFMGIEKIEPLVQRKDIDRRLWVLRREQIRNTGLRFKLQQVVSRYNTFAMYWMRIIREIEAGTYKRDVARAAKRFGTEALTIAAKRRLGKRGVAAADKEAEKRSVAPPPANDEGESTSPFRRSDLPLAERPIDQTIPDASPVSVSAPPPRMPSKPKQAPIHLDLDLDDEDDLFAGLDMKRGSAPPSPIPRPTSSPAMNARPASVPPPRPSAPVARAPSAAQAAPAPSRPAAPQAPAPSATHPAPPPPRPSAPQPPSAPGMRSGLAGSSPLRGSSLASSGNPFGPQGGERARPAPPAPKAAEPAPQAPRPAPARDGGDLSEGRVRELYAKYVDARRQCNEPTEKITSDSLAKSLRESATKLREKHAGKQVDFDVVIKDGKATLKPILKG